MQIFSAYPLLHVSAWAIPPETLVLEARISRGRPVQGPELTFKYPYFTLNYSLWPDFCIIIG
jgi:hypothetical protein